MTSYLPPQKHIFLFFFTRVKKKTGHIFCISDIFAHDSSKNKAYFDYMFEVMIFALHTTSFLGVVVLRTRENLFDDCLA